MNARNDDPEPDAVFTIPDEHALWLGRLIAASAAVEFYVETLVWLLLGVTPLKGRAVTSHLQMAPKLQTIDRLIAARSPPAAARADWAATRNLIEEISDYRAWAAHGQWITADKGEVRTVRTGGAPKGKLAGFRPMPLDDLKEKVDEADRAQKAVLGFLYGLPEL